jgi:hypothetical protein
MLIPMKRNLLQTSGMKHVQFLYSVTFISNKNCPVSGSEPKLGVTRLSSGWQHTARFVTACVTCQAGLYPLSFLNQKWLSASYLKMHIGKWPSCILLYVKFNLGLMTCVSTASVV